MIVQLLLASKARLQAWLISYTLSDLVPLVCLAVLQFYKLFLFLSFKYILLSLVCGATAAGSAEHGADCPGLID